MIPNTNCGIGKRLPCHPALPLAFGPGIVADRSVLQQIRDACTPQTVAQMKLAVANIYGQHSQGARHNYRTHWQLLDADVTGMPVRVGGGDRMCLRPAGRWSWTRLGI